jgi:hypothetical protein
MRAWTVRTQGVESRLLPHPQPERPLQEGQEGELTAPVTGRSKGR